MELVKSAGCRTRGWAVGGIEYASVNCDEVCAKKVRGLMDNFVLVALVPFDPLYRIWLARINKNKLVLLDSLCHVGKACTCV